LHFLENEFGYRIEDEELTEENFSSLRKLGELLASKTPNAPANEREISGDQRNSFPGAPLAFS
jgi:hypothetical protein